MASISESPHLKDITNAVDNLNFDFVRMKLQDQREGLGWSKEKTEVADLWYRRFLILNSKYPEASLVPTHDIDSFWHQHILDTRAYVVDCTNIFGRFLHHFPYFGMRGPEDAENLRQSFENTRALFYKEFGEVPPMSIGGSSDCDSSACEGQPSCGSSCSGNASELVHK